MQSTTARKDKKMHKVKSNWLAVIRYKRMWEL